MVIVAAKRYVMLTRGHTMAEKSSIPSVLHVARRIFELAAGSVGPMKLQKLVYYCQAWSLVWEDRPIFSEDFQAWANGPVCPELYDKHRGTYMLKQEFLSDFSGFEFNEADTHTIEEVLSFYGGKETFYLSELTHNERPWRAARDDTPMGEPSNAVISKESMQEYYAGIS